MNQRQSKDSVWLLQIKILHSKQDSGKIFQYLRGKLLTEAHYNMVNVIWPLIYGKCYMASVNGL